MKTSFVVLELENFFLLEYNGRYDILDRQVISRLIKVCTVISW